MLLVLYGILLYCFVRASIASDSTGRYLVAADNDNNNGGYIYASSDYGETWNTRTNAGFHKWYVNYYNIIIIV